MRYEIFSFVVAALWIGCGGSTQPGTDAGTSAGGSAGSAGAGGTGGSGACNPACGDSRACCIGHCANLANDPKNCGACGKVCSVGTYCGSGQCVTPPCSATCTGGVACCGTACCASGELCCDPQGPLDMGPRCTPPSDRGTCPMGCAPLCICASPDTPVATPEGNKPIADLGVGDLVYSIDRGMLRAVPIARTNRVKVSEHHVVRVVLATGAILAISSGHPTADGRRFGDLHAGDALDGVEIAGARLVPYEHDATYDILPDSDTGTYFAGGVLIGSTLAPASKGALGVTAPFTASSIFSP